MITLIECTESFQSLIYFTVLLMKMRAKERMERNRESMNDNFFSSLDFFFIYLCREASKKEKKKWPVPLYLGPKFAKIKYAICNQNMNFHSAQIASCCELNKENVKCLVFTFLDE